MSKTYRTAQLDLDQNHRIVPFKDLKTFWWEHEIGDEVPQDYFSKRNLKADHKPWYKPPKWYKKAMQKQRKAKERQAMKNGDYDNIPIFKKENERDWT